MTWGPDKKEIAFAKGEWYHKTVTSTEAPNARVIDMTGGKKLETHAPFVPFVELVKLHYADVHRVEGKYGKKYAPVRPVAAGQRIEKARLFLPVVPQRRGGGGPPPAAGPFDEEEEAED